MMEKKNRSQTIFRILGAVALVIYVAFLFGEGIPISGSMPFSDSSVYLLFALFVVAYYFLWKDEVVSGIMILVWYALEWILVFLVWIDGGMTLILGLPIAILGLILLIFGIRKRKAIASS